jgi:hypothetical protein
METINCKSCEALIYKQNSYAGRCADCEVRCLRAEVKRLSDLVNKKEAAPISSVR